MRNPLHYAVVVGVDRYPGLTDLRLPRNDATRFCEWLRDEDGGGLGAGNVRSIMRKDDETFSQPREARPRSDEIEWELVEIHECLRKAVADDPAAWEQSRLYVYVSGHGVAPTGGLGSIVFADAAPALNLWDLIELDALKSWYKRATLFRQVIVFADCCREQRPHAPALRLRFGEQRQRYGDSCDVLVVWGSEYAERAYEPQPDEVDATYGYFTTALIEGLKGGAADRNNGEISAVNLFQYISDGVIRMTRGTDFPQRPDYDGKVMEISIRPPGLGALPRANRRVSLTFPEGYGGRVELLRDDQEAIGEHDAGSGPWPVEVLDNVPYTVRPLDGQPALARGGAFTAVATGGDIDLS